jgi:hypothetical protein
VGPATLDGSFPPTYMPPADAGPAPGGTYPYDGGPRVPVPMPQMQPAPTNGPGTPATVPSDGRVVSLPAKPAKLTYPAYGENLTRPSVVVKDRLVKSEADKKTAR